MERKGSRGIRNEFGRNFLIANVFAFAGVVGAVSISEQNSLLDPSRINSIPSIGSSEKKQAHKNLNLSTLIIEQNEKQLKDKDGTEINLTLEKDVSIQAFPDYQSGRFLPLWGTFNDEKNKPVTFGMSITHDSPLAEFLEEGPSLPAGTIIKLQVITSHRTYLIETITPPSKK